MCGVAGGGGAAALKVWVQGRLVEKVRQENRAPTKKGKRYGNAQRQRLFQIGDVVVENGRDGSTKRE